MATMWGSMLAWPLSTILCSCEYPGRKRLGGHALGTPSQALAHSEGAVNAEFPQVSGPFEISQSQVMGCLAFMARGVWGFRFRVWEFSQKGIPLAVLKCPLVAITYGPYSVDLCPKP